jgi:pyridoxine 5-phosphate synthase
MPTALSVNVNKVALLRNSRHLGLPSVVRAAQLCLQAGAHGITVHPRPDARHIRHADVLDLGQLLQAWPGREFNIEGNPFHNLMAEAQAVLDAGLPLHQLTLVPDSEGQFTSDHGWRFPHDAERLQPLIAQAHAMGLRVSLFMDADASAMAAVRAVGADRVELYTEPFAAAHAAAMAQPQEPALQTALQTELQRFAQAAQAAVVAGLGVNAGHDLNLQNLPLFVRQVSQVQEVSIGHAFMADALEQGYAATVQAYLACMPHTPAPGGAQ